MVGGDLIALASGGVLSGAGPNLPALASDGVWSLLDAGRELGSGRVRGTVRSQPVPVLASAARVGGSPSGAEAQAGPVAQLGGHSVAGAARGGVAPSPIAINRRALALPTIEEG